VKSTNPKAILFKSKERFSAFHKKLLDYHVDTTILDFETHEWIDFDYKDIDFIIYYPSFKYSSSHPLALNDVYDNLLYLHSEYPDISFYPDPNCIKYYNDKYRQFLYLNKYDYPIPETIPILSETSLDLAETKMDMGPFFPLLDDNKKFFCSAYFRNTGLKKY